MSSWSLRLTLAFFQVCRLFRAIISEAVIFQYKIELGANGMEDGPSSALSAAHRLEKLKKHQAAWDELKWTEDKTVDMSIGHVWELYGGVLAQSNLNRAIFCRQLPSHLRGIEEKTWTVDISSFDLRDFTMDPSQDLLAIAEKPRSMYVSIYHRYCKQRLHDAVILEHHTQKLG